MENKSQGMMGNVVETNNGEVKAKYNKSNQNNINKVIKQPKKKKHKSKASYMIKAHEGIRSLQMLETTPKTPRETLKSIYNKGHRELYNVTFYVKGYLKGSNETMVTVENICWSCLLSWHCNIIVKNNPEIINYIGKLITCDIEIYPYPDNPDKFSFNIIDTPLYVETEEYYKTVTPNIYVEKFNVSDVDEFINRMIQLDIDYKLKCVNDIVNNLEGLSSLLYGNESIIINLVLNTMFSSTDIDRKVLSDGLFIKKHFYDVMMVLVKLIHVVSEKQIKRYKDLINEVLLLIGIYMDSPYINNYEYTADFMATCMYLNVSFKQAKFYYKNLIKPIYNGIVVKQDERKRMIKEMKQLVIDWCVSVN